MEHTKGKWEVNWITDHKCSIYSTPKQNHQEIRICRDVTEANARRIVTAVNLHDELVEACRAQQKANEWFGPSDTGRKLKEKARELIDDVLAKL